MDVTRFQDPVNQAIQLLDIEGMVEAFCAVVALSGQ